MSRLKKITTHVLVCVHKTCRQQGGQAVAKQLKRALKERGLQEHVMITKVKCLDQCGRGPVMVFYPDGLWYGRVDEDSVREIVAQHFTNRVGSGRLKILCDMREQAEKAG